mmetsp:Transcript_4826/g.8244  ORF Transcript_4826/g.8244 Transcript_4826/m.8244 type:complete len:215 (+) Transcript_4826:270-914(+)
MASSSCASSLKSCRFTPSGSAPAISNGPRRTGGVAGEGVKRLNTPPRYGERCWGEVAIATAGGGVLTASTGAAAGGVATAATGDIGNTATAGGVKAEPGPRGLPGLAKEPASQAGSSPKAPSDATTGSGDSGGGQKSWELLLLGEKFTAMESWLGDRGKMAVGSEPAMIFFRGLALSLTEHGDGRKRSSPSTETGSTSTSSSSRMTCARFSGSL